MVEDRRSSLEQEIDISFLKRFRCQWHEGHSIDQGLNSKKNTILYITVVNVHPINHYITISFTDYIQGPTTGDYYFLTFRYYIHQCVEAEREYCILKRENDIIDIANILYKWLTLNNISLVDLKK